VFFTPPSSTSRIAGRDFPALLRVVTLFPCQTLLRALALVFATTVFATPEKWITSIDKFTTEDRANPPPTDAVVFVGSSSIVKWTSLARDFPEIKTIKRGFGGSELADSVFYADRIVIPYHPRTVVVYAGDNDLKAGKSPETVAADFKAFRTKVHAALPDTKIIFIGVKPSPSRWDIRDKAIKANALIAADCATDRRRLALLDVWQPMLGPDGQPRPELYVADKLHMTPAGYAIWAPLLAPLLKP
jgi:hypothetical protein